MIKSAFGQQQQQNKKYQLNQLNVEDEKICIVHMINLTFSQNKHLLDVSITLLQLEYLFWYLYGACVSVHL